MNKVILMGRLTKDPEVKYSQGENSIPIARFALAVDRRGRKDANGDNVQTADFINCVAFQKNAEFIEKYFRQGMRVLISGRIQTGSYVKNDGQKVYTTDVIVEEQEFADSKNAAGSDNSSSGAFQNTSRPEPSAAVSEGFMNIPDGVDDEGLPFN